MFFLPNKFIFEDKIFVQIVFHIDIVLRGEIINIEFVFPNSKAREVDPYIQNQKKIFNMATKKPAKKAAKKKKK